MANQIDGILDKSKLTQENLEKIFRVHFQDESLTLEVKTEESDKVGAHYQSDISIIHTKLSNHEEPIKILVKAPMQSTFGRLMTRIGKPFMREAFWYNEAAPVLKNINPALANISPKPFYASSAYMKNYRPRRIDKKGLGTRLLLAKTDYGLTVMEFMDKCHILDNKKVMEIKNVKVVLRALAELHGTWMVWLRNQDPPTIGGLTKNEILESFAMPFLKKGDVNMMTSVLESIEKQMVHLNYPEDKISKLHKARKSDLSVHWNKLLYKSQPDSKWIIVSHGDCWTNNILFNEDESQVTLIDFQQIQSVHLAADLWYFFYVCTDSNWRKHHLEDSLRHYFEHLLPHLAKAQIKATFEEFLDEVNKYKLFGFICGVAMTHTILEAGVDTKSILAMMRSVKKLKQKFSHPMAANETEDVKEANRRLFDVIEENVFCEGTIFDASA